MKRYYLVILCSLFLFVGCSNKATGDQIIYVEVKKALMNKINGLDKDKKKEVTVAYGLDKKNLDELPLAIYNVNGRYVGVVEISSGDEEYFYYSVKNKKIVTKLDEKVGALDFGHLTPVYSQNGFN